MSSGSDEMRRNDRASGSNAHHSLGIGRTGNITRSRRRFPAREIKIVVVVRYNSLPRHISLTGPRTFRNSSGAFNIVTEARDSLSMRFMIPSQTNDFMHSVSLQQYALVTYGDIFWLERASNLLGIRRLTNNEQNQSFQHSGNNEDNERDMNGDVAMRQSDADNESTEDESDEEFSALSDRVDELSLEASEISSSHNNNLDQTRSE